MRSLRLVLFLLFCSATAVAQFTKDPTNWTFETVKKDATTYDVIFRVRLEPEWHLFSQNPGGDGSFQPPSIQFAGNPAVKFKGRIREKGTLINEDVDADDIKENYYEGTLELTQTVTVADAQKGEVTVVYTVCNHSTCLPPKKKSFPFQIGEGTPDTAVVPPADTAGYPTVIAPESPTQILSTGDCPNAGTAAQYAALKADTTTTVIAEKPNLVSLFGKGVGAGLFAVITPCVFAMLPMNVSFFLKRSSTRKKAILTALQYSFSILLIFLLIGLTVSLLPRNAFNNLSTNWIVNLFFFAIFIVFGMSFLGAFEINLPSSWATKIDSKANTRNFFGIFFMALTLVIVSFSCTVPFIGGLLFLVQDSGPIGPVTGFLGFGVGLALPFTLFVIFPALLNEFGKQGGWLNAVKVVFGFVELALALKFLSNADLAQGWRLLDREIFIACWIGLAFVLGIYLLGGIRFSHDSELPKNDWGLPYLKVPRLIFALSAIIFGIYLIPGMWGAPLNGMSAFLPSVGTQDFIINTGNNTAASNPLSISGHATPDAVRPCKYVAQMRVYEPLFVTQNGIETYFDYNEALAAAKVLKKPVLIDFTGINCASCRKMESQVFSNPKVAAILKEKFVIATLYCDYDQVTLPKNERFKSKMLDANVETLGDLNEHIQATLFNSNSQPFYFFVDESGRKLVQEGYQYDPSVEKFMAHIARVQEEYKRRHP